MTITDLYDVGITILGFGCRKVSLGCRRVSLGCRKVSFGSQKVSFGSQKVTSGHLESSLCADFGAWEGPRTGFANVAYHFWVILDVILEAQSDPESHKFEV